MPDLASDGSLNRIICKHCTERERIEETGPSSDKTPGNDDEDSSSDSSHEEDKGDPDYTDGRDT